MHSPPERITSIDAFRGFVMFLMLAEAMRLWTLHDASPGSRVWAIWLILLWMYRRKIFLRI